VSWAEFRVLLQQARARDDIDRSLRRGSDSRAKALGVSTDDINGVHRWEKVEQAKGRKAAQSMSDHYADVEHLRPVFMRYTQGL
jgi:hypothetical protein